MLMEQALALYDEGAALPNVLEQLLTSAGDRRIEVGGIARRVGDEAQQLGATLPERPLVATLLPRRLVALPT